MEQTVPALVDVEDPLLIEFARQHDYRERFLNALERIISIISSTDVTDYTRAARVALEIAKEAVDPEHIAKWEAEGRPLPALDAKVGDRAEALRQTVLTMLDSRGDVGVASSP